MASNPVHQPRNVSVNSVDARNDNQHVNMVSNDTALSENQKPSRLNSLEPPLSPNTMQTPPKPKKGGFQITKIVTKQHIGDHVTDDHDGDSLDDTEDVSSEIVDVSRTTDIEQDPSSSDTITSLAQDDVGKDVGTKQRHPSNSSPPHHRQPQYQNTQGATVQQNHIGSMNTPVTSNSVEARPVSVPAPIAQSTPLVPITQQQLVSQPPVPVLQFVNAPQDGRGKPEKPGDGQSTRFKVVKIESKEPFKRGRWTCQDFLDPPQKAPGEAGEKTDKPSEEYPGSGNSSAASSVHYVPGEEPSGMVGMNVVYSDGHPIFEPQAIRPMGGATQGHISNGGDYVMSQCSIPSTLTSDLAGLVTMSSQNPMSSTLPSQNQNPQTAPVAPSSGAPSMGPPTTVAHPTATQPATAQSSLDFLKPKPTAPSGTGGQGLASSSVATSGQQGMLKPSASMGDFSTAVQGTAQVNTSGSTNNTTSPNNENMQAKSEFSIPTDTILYASGVSGEEKRTHLTVDSHLLDPSAFKSMSQNSLTPPLLEMVSAMNPIIPGMKDDDESGASTVAIDNKIEQAMDLVKSHLMFAVREEVEVLKEQIKELLEKNSQLEYENSILRNSASAETLAKLKIAGAGSATTTVSTAPPPTTSSS